jgi:glycosyltransferase involved in cell wall biosynthesis
LKDLSVAIITKNEEKRLPDCLRSISFADEIVVVDSHSTDNTVEIARSFGCRVFPEDWKGYGPQKISALGKCRNEWVLILDADERLAGGAKEIIEKIQWPQATAFRFRRKNHLHGRWMKHSGYWPDWQIRLVNRQRGSFQGKIHEQWVTDGPIHDLDACICHYSFSGYSDMLKRLNNYSTVDARELYAAGRRTTPAAPLYHGIGMFFKIFLIEKGFLDGIDGLVTAITKAGGSFFKYAKLLELQREDKRGNER